MSNIGKITVVLLAICTILLLKVISMAALSKNSSHKSQEKSSVKEDEKNVIDQWISDNKLNQYGDPLDTIYSGGTPLFDEANGTTIDRYTYVKNRHPDKPWEK